ncbi:hypothetical protein AAKU67_003671 [Oxalobacteraceae bacterium GrIS 2.11]
MNGLSSYRPHPTFPGHSSGRPITNKKRLDPLEPDTASSSSDDDLSVTSAASSVSRLEAIRTELQKKSNSFATTAQEQERIKAETEDVENELDRIRNPDRTAIVSNRISGVERESIENLLFELISEFATLEVNAECANIVLELGSLLEQQTGEFLPKELLDRIGKGIDKIQLMIIPALQGDLQAAKKALSIILRLKSFCRSVETQNIEKQTILNHLHQYLSQLTTAEAFVGTSQIAQSLEIFLDGQTETILSKKSRDKIYDDLGRLHFTIASFPHPLENKEKILLVIEHFRTVCALGGISRGEPRTENVFNYLLTYRTDLEKITDRIPTRPFNRELLNSVKSHKNEHEHILPMRLSNDIYEELDRLRLRIITCKHKLPGREKALSTIRQIQENCAYGGVTYAARRIDFLNKIRTVQEILDIATTDCQIQRDQLQTLYDELLLAGNVFDELLLAKISLVLEAVSLKINAAVDPPKNPADKQAVEEGRKALNNNIYALQRVCDPAWYIQDHETNNEFPPEINSKKRVLCGEIIQGLRAVAVPILSLNSGRLSSDISSVLTNFFRWKSDPKSNQDLLNQISIQLISIRSELARQTTRQEAHYAKSEFLSCYLDHLIRSFEELETPEIYPRLSPFVFTEVEMIDMLSKIQSLTTGTNSQVWTNDVLEDLKTELKESVTLTLENIDSILAAIDTLSFRLTQSPNKVDVIGVSIDFIQKNIRCFKEICEAAKTKLSKDRSDETNLKSKTGFLIALQTIRPVLKGFASDVDLALAELEEDIRKIHTEPNLEEWARISLRLKFILDDFKKHPQESIHNGRSLHYIEKALGHLQFVSHFAWAEKSHNAIVRTWTPHFIKEQVDPALSKTKTVGGSIGVKVGMPVDGLPGDVGVSGDLGGNNLRGRSSDDELYYGERDINTGSLSGAGDFGIGNIGASGAYGQGTYKEWDNAREYILDNFAKLVGEQLQYATRPDIRRFLSPEASTGISRALSDQMVHFSSLQQQYEQQQDHIAGFFSVLQSLGKPPSTQATNKRKVKLSDTIAMQAGEALKADISNTVVAAHGELGFGVTEHTKLGFGFDGTPFQKTTLDIAKYKPICSYLSDSTDEKNRKNIKDDLANHSQVLLDKLFRKGGLWAGKTEAQFGPSSSTSPAESTVKKNKARYKLLKADFEEYSRFQRQLSYGDPSTQASVNLFHEKYQTKDGEKIDTENCVARMLMLTGLMYSEIMDLKDGTEDLSELKEGLKALEKTLLKPPFMCDRSKVEKLTSFKENFELTTSDRKISFSFIAAIGKVASLAFSCVGSLLIRNRTHVHIFRSGDYIDWTVRVSGGLSTESVIAVLKKGTEVLQDTPNMQDTAKEIAGFLDQLNPDIPGADPWSMPLSEGIAYEFTCRFYKPEKFKIVPPGKFHGKLEYISLVETTSSKVNPKIPFPVAPAVWLRAGLSHETSSSRLIKYWFSPNTNLAFALRYLHEFATGHGDTSTGEFNKKDPETDEAIAPKYWHILKKEQESVLKKLFQNVAAEYSTYSRTENGEVTMQQLPLGCLLQEFDEFERVLTDKLNVIELINALRQLRSKKQEFIDAARDYSEAVATSNQQQQQRYEAALKKYEALLFAYYQHVKRYKGAYPKSKTEVLLATKPKPTLAEKIVKAFSRRTPAQLADSHLSSSTDPQVDRPAIAQNQLPIPEPIGPPHDASPEPELRVALHPELPQAATA